MAGVFSYVMRERALHSRGRARASYNMISWFYDALTFSEESLRELGLRQLDVREGDAVLEVGCGTGGSLVKLAKRAGRAYGIDISDGMCRRAQNRIWSSGVGSNAGVVLGDAAMLPFMGASFDRVFMCFTLELFNDPDMRAVLSECGRVLRPEGRICVVAMAKSEKENFMSKLYGAAHALYPDYVDCRPIDAGGALEGAGFEVIDTKKASTFGLPVNVVTAIKRPC
jgi:ubiquinone/menaquinone biosynthesis C-methylase UbiE